MDTADETPEVAPIFTVVPRVDSEALRRTPRARAKWRQVAEALGDGSVLRVKIDQDRVQSLLGLYVAQLYPGKRVTTRRTDDPEYTNMWLVDR